MVLVWSGHSLASESWDLYSTGTVQFCSPLLIWILFGAKLFRGLHCGGRDGINGNKPSALLAQDITITRLRFWPTNLIFMVHYGGVKVEH